MLKSHRLKSLSNCFRTGRKRRVKGNGKRFSRRALLESLENRALLTTFTVTSLADSGVGSLRDAIQQANATSGADVIEFSDGAGGSVNFHDATPDTITLGGTELTISSDVTINGPGADLLTVSGNDASRVLNVSSGTVVIDALTIADGRIENSVVEGGGIRNAGTLTLSNTAVTANTAGSVSIVDGIFNTTILSLGGGIFNEGGLTLTNSTVSGNTANSTASFLGPTLPGFSNSFGGGIYNSGTFTLTNSTVSENMASSSTFIGVSRSTGGGVHNSGTVTLTNSTVSGNAASSSSGVSIGGGIYNDTSGSLTAINSIVLGNVGALADVGGSIAKTNSLVGAADADWKTVLVNDGTAPILTDNGGPTQTIALIADTNNPATDAGDNALATSDGTAGGTPLTTDQRGADFDRIIGGTVDIGAYEFNPSQTFTVTTLADLGAGSLRNAIQLANANPGSHAIEFSDGAGGSTNFHDAIPDTITLGGTELTVSSNVTINGPGADLLTVSGNGASRVLNVLSGTVVIDAMTIADGMVQDSAAEGGGIRNAGTLTLTKSAVSRNTAASMSATAGRLRSSGGGIFNAAGGILTLVESTISGNTAHSSSTGSNSFLSSGNSYGGGIHSDGTLTVTNSTVTGNTASATASNSATDYSYSYGTSYGGGINNKGTLTITNSTISGNAASANATANTNANHYYFLSNSYGGGFVNDYLADTAAINAIVLGNTAQTDPDAHNRALISRNAITKTNSLVGAAEADWKTVLVNDGTAPILTDNGGPTPTIALVGAADNPAIDAGDNSLATSDGTAAGTLLSTDQRGPDFDRIIGGTVDVGAYEFNPAQSFTVTTLADSGQGSLRNAIQQANATPGDDVILFNDDPANGVNFHDATPDTITLSGMELTISSDITISGPGADLLTVSGGGISRVLNVATGTVTINALTIADGSAEDTFAEGGGIRNAGTLTLTDSVVSGNRATTGGFGYSNSTMESRGGGIFNAAVATLTLTNTTVSGNTAESSITVFDGHQSISNSFGGGIQNDGTLTVTNSTVSGNTASANSTNNFPVEYTYSEARSYGGGINNRGTFTLTNSTVSGNTASASAANTSPSNDSYTYGYSFGGGINNIGTFTLTNSTVSGNAASASHSANHGISGSASYGGGIVSGALGSATGTVINSLVLGNISDIDSDAHDQSPPSASGITKTNSLFGDDVADWKTVLVNDGTDPILAENGGPTKTIALVEDSNNPAIDTGDDLLAVDANGDPLTTDQRGDRFARFINTVDIGAFELHHAQFVVNTVEDTSDTNPGDGVAIDANGLTSLRAAIEEANALANIVGPDIISFDIPGSNHLIVLGSQLPTVNESVVINGTTEPDFSGTPIVQIDGGGTIADGLRVEATGVTIRGLSITGFTNDGVELFGGSDHQVVENYLGLDPSGAIDGNRFGLKISNSSINSVDGNVISGNTASGVYVVGATATSNTLTNNFVGTDPVGQTAAPNGGNGIFLLSPGNTVGGTGQGNVISGNAKAGLSLFTSANNTIVQGNYIGTNPDGTAAIANQNYGMLVQSSGNTIGGSQLDGTGNLVSGNNRHGLILLETADNNSINGNLFGTDATGDFAIPNTSYGIYLLGGSNNTVGTASAGEGNLVSGNDRSGIVLQVDASGNSIVGNKVGTNADGNSALPNKGSGVLLTTDSSGNAIVANQIAGNTGIGLTIVGDNSSGNSVQDNLIGTDSAGTTAIGNGAFGILLASPNNMIGGLLSTEGNVVAGSSKGIVLDGVNSHSNVVANNWIGLDQSLSVDLGVVTGIQFGNDAHDNTIGPDNVIANHQTGVRFTGASGLGNKITQNSFTNNSVVGIDLANLGPTSNDVDDLDEGPNRGINHPELSSATIVNDDLEVEFSVPTPMAAATYPLDIEFFLTDGDAQGNEYLGTASYTQNDIGTNITITFEDAAGSIFQDQYLTATSTDAVGNTSEFSAQILIMSEIVLVSPPAYGRSTMDMNSDGNISAADALWVINKLNNEGVEGESVGQTDSERYSALDALRIINWLGTSPETDAERDRVLVDSVLTDAKFIDTMLTDSVLTELSQADIEDADHERGLF